MGRNFKRNWHRGISQKTAEFLKKKAEGFIGNRRGFLLRENGRKKPQEVKAKLLNSYFGLI